MGTTLYYLNLILLGVGASLHLASLFTDRPGPRRVLQVAAVATMAAGFIGVTAGQAQRWAVQQRVPIGNSHEFLMTLAWFISLGYFIVIRRGAPRAVGAALAVGIFLAVSFAGVFPARMEMVLLPALQSNWLKIHVSLNIIGEAAFAVAFTAGLLYLLAGTRWHQTSRPEKMLALALFLASVAGGLSLVLLMRFAGVVSFDPLGRSPMLSLLGAGLMISLVLFPLLWWKLSPGTGSNLGGGIFALAVLSVLVSGVILGRMVGSREQAGSQLEQRLLVVENMLAGMTETISRADWVRQRRDVLARVDVFESLREIHDSQGYSLERGDVAGVAVPEDVSFPLTLGEIREELRGLSSEMALRDDVAGGIGFPLTRTALLEHRARLIESYTELEQSRIIPTGAGRETVFIALMVLGAIPLFFILWPLATRLAPRLPGLETLERTTYRAVTIGFPVFTMGAMVFGAIWAHHAWGKWWSNDPKEIGALMVCVVYAIYLHMRMVKGWKGNHAAIAAVTGFAIAMLSFVGNWVLDGLHSYG